MRVTPLSAISWLEVLQGMRNKAELVVVKKMLQHRAATLLPVSMARVEGDLRSNVAESRLAASKIPSIGAGAVPI